METIKTTRLYGIYNSGSEVTLNGGEGDDTVENDEGANVLIEYADGDTDTYYKETVGSDIIVNVGEGKITLVGAANLDTVNIDGVYKDSTTSSPVTLDDSVEVLDASKRTTAIQIDSILAGAGNDSINGGGGSIIFTNVKSGSQININGTTKTISGNTLK